MRRFNFGGKSERKKVEENGRTLTLRLARKCPNLIQRNGLRKISNYGGKS
jgi:hypothetical protein